MGACPQLPASSVVGECSAVLGTLLKCARNVKWAELNGCETRRGLSIIWTGVVGSLRRRFSEVNYSLDCLMQISRKIIGWTAMTRGKGLLTSLDIRFTTRKPGACLFWAVASVASMQH